MDEAQCLQPQHLHIRMHGVADACKGCLLDPVSAPVAIHSCIHGRSAMVGGAVAAPAVTAAADFRLPGLCFCLVLIVGSFVCSSAPVC